MMLISSTLQGNKIEVIKMPVIGEAVISKT
jgi:hypothetical protein